MARRPGLGLLSGKNAWQLFGLYNKNCDLVLSMKLLKNVCHCGSESNLRESQKVKGQKSDHAFLPEGIQIEDLTQASCHAQF